jgi:hypothetical protein
LLDLNIAAGFLALLALIGQYGRQIEEAGRLGLVAFVLSALGMVLTASPRVATSARVAPDPGGYPPTGVAPG